ncbi:MAG: serine protease, partial [Phycisphaerae bacterium]|nr:serine protease [Phycisphaerae bacterium]
TGQDSSSCADGYDFYDVWHLFIPTATADYSISLCNSDFDTSLSILDDLGTEIGCNDDACGSKSKLDVPLTGGKAYYIRIAGYDGATGNYALDITRYLVQPINDECANAIDLSLNTPYYGTTNAATGIATSGCSTNDKLDVWHSFTPASDGYHTISLCGSSFDTTLSVYDGCGGNSLACNDNMCDLQSEVVVDLTAGQRYLVRIAGKGGKTGDYVIVASERFTQPANDDCASAIEVFEDVPYSGSNAGALGDTGSSCGYYFDFYDVWHSFTPTETKDYYLSLCGSDFDTVLSLYDSCGGTELGCNDDSCSSQSALTASLTAGQTYVVRVSGYDGAMGNYQLNISESVPAPVNDECANAIALELNVPYTGSTESATGSSVSSCGDEDFYDVWFSYTPVKTESYIIDLCESEFDTTLSVYDSCTAAELACNDDACGSQSQLTMSLEAGNTYLLRVAGYRGAIGTFTIAVTCNCVLVDAPETPYPDDKAYNIERDVTLAWDSGKTILDNLASTGITLKGIYGTDDRIDEYQVTNPSLKAIGDSTVALVSAGDLTDNGDGTYSLPTETLAEYYLDQFGRPLCPDEPFRDQPSPSLCTGFLVAPDLVITTGHCLESSSVCSDRAFIFGFKMLNSSTAVTTFDSSDVYYCKGVIARTQTADSDWALIRLDREVTNHAPIAVRRSDTIADAQNVTVIGHTLGLPRKYASNAWVQENTQPNNFQVNLDTYMGSSGSPVVNMNTYEVEGILFSGNPDFVEDGGCDRSAVYPDSGDPDWERVTRSTEFSDLIPVFDVYLGTDPTNMQLIASDISKPWCTAGDLDCGENYYWQVVIKTSDVIAPGEIWVFSTKLAGDFDHDCDVDLEDFSELAQKWMLETCDITNNYCQGTDIDKLGSVSMEDLVIFVENWLSE